MSDPTKRDLVLPPGSYAYIQDSGKGLIKTCTGPSAFTPTGQDVPVIYDPTTGQFKTASLEDARCWSPVAPEGSYMVLFNPAKDNKHPADSSHLPSEQLEVGRRINVPGPATFALWPGQAATVIAGHPLRSNEYLIARVYNEDEARRNWTAAVVKLAVTEGTSGEPGAPSGDKPVVPQTVSEAPEDLAVGKMLLIRGTEVAFFIPPTGIEVVPDEQGSYVRAATTLERLEYSILVDENGEKRYERGPQVVFPLPTERFIEQKDERGQQTRKFRAVELNPIQGLHIKVIADYEENNIKYKAGEELFITGKQTAIYFPREEHSTIRYDGKTKHFATAVPAGEARYVMNRLTGEILMVKGPAMLLPDPRKEVLVRRVLSDRQCELWYPGNQDVLEHNRNLRDILQNVPTTRQGAISEGDYERGTRGAQKRSYDKVATNSVMEASRVSGDQSLAGEEFSRASTYTEPRQVVMASKYQGAPEINVWTGYAVLVVSKTGHRRVEHGPTTVLLGYDETLEVLELSTGKPKTTDSLLRTVYLRTENNKIGDIIEVETADHVKVEIKVSYRVNFEGDSAKWFKVENYVKTLCDHARSVLKGAARKVKIEDLYAASTDFIRDTILGKATEGAKRPGLPFEENGMRVNDVEVLGVTLKDERIRQLLDTAQHEVVKTNIELASLARNRDATRAKEAIAQEEAAVRADTKKKSDLLAMELAKSELLVILTKLGNTLQQFEEQKKNVKAEQEIEEARFASNLDRDKRQRVQELELALRDQEQQIQLIVAETESVVKRFTSAQGGFSEALLALSNNETLVKMAQAMDTARTVGGEAVADIFKRLFKDTPLSVVLDRMAPGNNGSSRTSHPAM